MKGRSILESLKGQLLYPQKVRIVSQLLTQV